MFVHAHPDDECSANAMTMAKLVDEGAQVTLVTCTLGEEGEVLVPELAHLAAVESDELGPHRLTELHAAMKVLGVTDYLRLGGDGRFRDSGMVYDDRGMAKAADEVHPNALWRVDLLEAANELVPIIRDRRPQVLITYDEFGNYGHPDHVMANRIATYAVALAGVPSYRRDLGQPWVVQRLLWTTMSASVMRAGIQALRDSGDTETFANFDLDGTIPMAAEDHDIAVRISGPGLGAKKLAALKAHATQIDWQGSFFAMFAKMTGSPDAAEYYRFASGVPLPERQSDDLFAGLAHDA